MSFQTLFTIIYEVVKHSWNVSTVLTKYFILGLSLKTVSEETAISNLEENLLAYRKEYVTGVIVLGIISMIAGWTVEPFFKLFSELLAVLYFAYLFWKY
ncbi:MAG: hypothetical protein ABEJ99_04635 [Candidatus Nanohaloarchaea archaeon]